MAFEDKRKQLEAALSIDNDKTELEPNERRVQASMTLRSSIVKKAKAEAEASNTTLSRFVENILIDYFKNESGH